MSWIIENGSVRQRINYWELALDIFQNNKFGVGIDNMGDYASRFRSEKLFRQEGLFTIPDRAHNVFLDYFVNGGFVGGILWFVFVVSVSFLAVRVLLNRNSNEEPYLLCTSIIWLLYVVQSSISVDHLVLTLIGFSSGGFIVNNFIQSRLHPRDINQKIKVNLFKSISIFSFILTFLTLSSVYLISAIAFDKSAFKFIYLNDINQLPRLLQSRVINVQTLEDVTVKLSQAKQFKLANSFAEKLLDSRPNSHQGYYIESVYLESIGSIRAARDKMIIANSLDPYNSVYTLSLSIFELNLRNLDKARDYLERTLYLNPAQVGIKDVVDALDKADN